MGPLIFLLAPSPCVLHAADQSRGQGGAPAATARTNDLARRRWTVALCFQGEGAWSAELVSQTPIRATHDDGIRAGLLTQLVGRLSGHVKTRAHPVGGLLRTTEPLHWIGAASRDFRM